MTRLGPRHTHRPSPRVWVAAGIAVVIGALTFVIWWATGAPGPEGPGLTVADFTIPRGGALTGAIRETDEPGAVALLTQATLVRINRSTDRVEPWLAESWTASAAAPSTYTFKLRANTLWSDAVPFTSDDVVFTFRALYAQGDTNSIWGSLLDAGKPLAVLPIDPLTVEIAFPAPFAAALRLLDTLTMLPKHTLEKPLNDGTFAKAGGPKTPPGDIPGLGPFVPGGAGLRTPGAGARTLTFARNPHYWRTAPDGKPLPYLESLVLQIAPEDGAQLRSLLEGQVDFIDTELPPDLYTALKRADAEGKVRLYDLGPGLDGDALWFNLAPGPEGPGLRRSKPWIAKDDFRLAVSTAVNRRLFCDTVYPGGCDPIFGPVTPGSITWFVPDLPAAGPNQTLARSMLAGLGLRDQNGDGMLEDDLGRPVRFTMLVPNGVATAERGAAFVRDELRKVGIGVDVVGVVGLVADVMRAPSTAAGRKASTRPFIAGFSRPTPTRR